MKIIALTGNIGSGKSTVASLFSRRGIPVIDLDRLGHRVLAEKTIGQRLVRMFGPSILAGRKIHRPLLRKTVFSHPRTLARFNRLVHPPLIRLLRTEIQKHKKQKRPFLLIDAALIFEMKIAHWADTVITVRAGKLISWLRSRKTGYGEFLRIHRSQMPVREKAERSDFVIRNDLPFCLSKNFLEKKVQSILDGIS